ncbi:MAG: Flp pilus assembly complex ATPase component TadA [Nitrospirae bacterium]|nr:Flp pilus assembly complex ATPase component TadA [Candidatus Manganitrophaceae bacterium]
MDHTTRTEGQKRRLGDFLIETGHLTPDHLKQALDEQKKMKKRLGEVLIDLQMISETQIARSLAVQLGLRYTELAMIPIDPGLLLLIPKALAKRHLAIPLEIQNKKLTVAMSDPLDYESINDLRFHSGMAIDPIIATRRAILETIEQNYHLDSSVEKIVEASAKEFNAAAIQIIPQLDDGALLQSEARSLEERSRLAPIIQLANLILNKAIKLRASDIHIEPEQKDFRIRYRIDGLMREDMRLPKGYHTPLVSRIKILAKLNIAERRLPQDGAVRVMAENHEIDLRVSTLPTHHGEKVVLRILDQSKMMIQLDQIGLPEKGLSAIHQMTKRKKGIILVTGPTGSGKTTTLYAMINELRSETTNLTTVEDPVEYTIEGVNQIQINPEIGLTFANCLRSILRQDPNVILVGEIRDLETAEIAFRAAMTGHLVLSTVHTNDAVSTITRLVDIGIPRYLVSSALTGVIAQRLVRKLCLKCRVETTSAPAGRSDPLETNKMAVLVPAAEGSLFQERGCSQCHYAGFSGRIGLFEVLDLSPKLRERISAGATDQEIRSTATALGMTSMEEDGHQKIRQGTTTLGEVMRAVEMEESFKSLCPECGRSLHLDFLICPHCGCTSPYVCGSCGKLLHPEWSVCPYCRSRRTSVPDGLLGQSL